MASTILTNWTVYYSDDAPAGSSGYKQIRWTGAGGPETNTNTVNELYSALMDLFSISTQIGANDSTPMRAVTPTVYEIGSFDLRDLEPWFIDPDSIKHLTGGSIQTVNWTREENADANLGLSGILKVPYTGGTPFVSSDIGRAIANGTATGTLLWYDTTNSEAWIRPTNCTSTHNWAGPAGTISVTGGTGSVTQNGTAVSGERIWANIYTLGTITTQTQIYVTQNFTTFTPTWWSDGHIDRLFLTNDGFSNGLIDDGLMTIYARQYSKLYDHFQTDVSGGGRTPVPLSTSIDVNNTSGYRTITAVPLSGTGTFTVGNYIYYDNSGTLTWSTTTKKGIITAVGGTSGALSTPTITYYLTGDLTDFSVSDTIQEYDPATSSDADGSCTTLTVTNTGPAGTTPSLLTIAAGGVSQDLGNGNGLRPYSITLNLQLLISLSQMYQRTKYLTRRGSTGDIETQTSQTLIGEQYQGIGDYYVPYDNGSIDNPFNEGETVTVTGSDFTGTITSKHDRGTNEGFLIIRHTRGTAPTDNEQLVGSTSTNTADVDENAGSDPVETITEIKVSPFGTFAGTTFFGARGVWLSNVPAADASNYELIDSEGDRQVAPATIAVAVGGIVAGDKVSVFRASDQNGTIEVYLSSNNTTNVAGDTTFNVNETLDSDTPASGVIRVIDSPGEKDHRYRYTSWTGNTFTLVTTNIPSGTISSVGSDKTRIFRADSANLVNILPGDMVRNTTDDCWGHVISVTLISGTIYEVVHTPLTSGITNNYWTAGDSYSFNNLVETYDVSDLAYVPYIDQTATDTSVSVSVTYDQDRNITTRVRRKGIQPFTVNNIQLTNSGYTATAVRTTDTIVT